MEKTLIIIFFGKGSNLYFGGVVGVAVVEGWPNITKHCHLDNGPMGSPYNKQAGAELGLSPG